MTLRRKPKTNDQKPKTMLHYIIQVLLFQTLFLAIYDLFLKRETFFQWNRFYLMFSSVLAYVIPFIKIESASNYLQQNIGQLPEVVLNPEIIFLNEVNLSVKSTSIFTLENFYFLGIGIASLLFIYKISLIIHKIYKNTIIKKKAYHLVILPKQQTAFSFFKYLFLGKMLYENNHQHIIKHELTHIKQKHSVDLIYFELQKIVFWFNPFSYLFQNRIAALHEFIADEKTIKQDNKQSFFENLLTQSFQVEKFAFVNQYYKKSLIKKRIIMATKRKSKEILKLKYLLIIPLMFVMVGFTSLMKETNQTIDNKDIEVKIEKTKPIFIKKEIKQVLDTIIPVKSSSIITEKEIIEDVPFSVIDESPIYPGCETSINKKKCMSNKIATYVSKEFNVDLAQGLGLRAGKKRITTQFKIDNQGNVSHVRVRAPHPKLKEEVVRVIKGLPKMKPGKKRGKAVNVRYNLPIVFNVEGDVKTTNQESIIIKDKDLNFFRVKPYDSMDKIISFKLKIPNYPAMLIKGNRFNTQAINRIRKSKKDSFFIIFDIETKEKLFQIKPIVFNVKYDKKYTNEPIDTNRLVVLLDKTQRTFPIYPACESEANPTECSTTKLIKFINHNFNKEKAKNLGLSSGWKRVQVSFFVNDKGSVEVTRIDSPHKELDKEVNRLFNSIPKMKPSIIDNKPVNSKTMIIPINFFLD